MHQLMAGMKLCWLTRVHWHQGPNQIIAISVKFLPYVHRPGLDPGTSFHAQQPKLSSVC
jgi:hypothetical protein